MKFADILKTVFIILIFALLYFSAVLAVGLKKLKEDWPKYRCVPTMMPFASYLGHDTAQNFSFCVGNIQKDLMSFFLEPIEYILGNIGGIAEWVIERIQFIRLFVDKLRNMLTTLVQDVYGMFVNILIQFQKLIIKLKDTLMKVTGIITTMVFLVHSAMLTGQSIDRGPIGKVLRTLCFSPDTPLTLNNGSIVIMKDIHLGDILEGGIKVVGKLSIQGNKHNPYYKIWSEKLKENIFVTGSHKIYNENNKDNTKNIQLKKSKLENYIDVEHHPCARPTNLWNKEYSCLITSNHKIPVGEYTFWDWED